MLKFLMSAAVLVSVAAVASAADKDPKRERLICKREAKTGSLVSFKRTCLTREQWRVAEEYNKQGVKDMQNAIDGAQKNG
jgi:hypothetical protein